MFRLCYLIKLHNQSDQSSTREQILSSEQLRNCVTRSWHFTDPQNTAIGAGRRARCWFPSGTTSFRCLPCHTLSTNTRAVPCTVLCALQSMVGKNCLGPRRFSHHWLQCISRQPVEWACVCVRADRLNSAVGLALVPLGSLFWSSRLEGFDYSATSVASE